MMQVFDNVDSDCAVQMMLHNIHWNVCWLIQKMAKQHHNMMASISIGLDIDAIVMLFLFYNC